MTDHNGLFFMAKQQLVSVDSWESGWCDQCVDRVGSRRYRKLHPNYGWCLECLNNPRFTRPKLRSLEIVQPQKVARIVKRRPAIIVTSATYPSRLPEDELQQVSLLQDLILWLAKHGEMSNDWAESIQFFFQKPELQPLRDKSQGRFDSLLAFAEASQLRVLGLRAKRRGNQPMRLVEDYFLGEALKLLKNSPATFNQLRQQLGIKKGQRSYLFFPTLLKKIGEREDSPIERCEGCQHKSFNRAYWQIKRPQEEIEITLSANTYERLTSFCNDRDFTLDKAMREFLTASGY